MPDILKTDLPVEFAGMRSSLVAMHNAGWDMQVSMDYRMDETQILMRHSGLEIYAATNQFNLMVHSGIDGHYFRNIPPLRIQVMGKDIVYQFAALPFGNLREMKSPYLNVELEHGRLSRLPWFDTHRPADEGKIIYVEDANVTDLMTIILEKQAPKQAEIRERLKKEENRSRIIKPEANIVRLFA